MKDAVQLNGVHKWVGQASERTTILQGVHLSVEAGDYVAVMGASGSGKSTLLNLVGLLDRPSRGAIHLFGRDVSSLRDEEAARIRAKSIGYIFQSFNLLPYLTVHENVALPLGYIGHPDADARVTTLLKQVKLDHRARAYPTTLSGGEKQRVAIARALANRPSLVLADEPTGSLDSKTGMHVMELIGQLQQEGTTLMVVTHDEKVARRARRIIHMKDGAIA
jgi:putative ABC transport system ATP-binding protein